MTTTFSTSQNWQLKQGKEKARKENTECRLQPNILLRTWPTTLIKWTQAQLKHNAALFSFWRALHWAWSECIYGQWRALVHQSFNCCRERGMQKYLDLDKGWWTVLIYIIMIGLAKPFKGNLNRLKAFTAKDDKFF
jgi:hypothetical protein